MTEQKMSPAAKEHARWIARALAAEAERDRANAEIAGYRRVQEDMADKVYAAEDERDESLEHAEECDRSAHMAEDRAEAAEAERDALLPIKESWSQLKRELDEVRAERNALAVDLRQCRTRPVVTQLVAAEATAARYREALERLRPLHEAATPGPWIGSSVPSGRKYGVISVRTPDGGGRPLAVLSGVPTNKRHADTQLIVAMRNELAAALTEPEGAR